jgi:hypothetical protein
MSDDWDREPTDAELTALEAEQCIHGIWPSTSCTYCNGREEREAKAARTVVRRWAAMFDGPLACGCTAVVGDPIVRMGDGRIICEDCAP